jgi:calcineurin-like phosphoesterase family protein
MIWFTADWHYDHENIIKYFNRPFPNVNEMNKTLINSFLALVDRKKDILYFLGDLSFSHILFERLAKEVFPRNTIFVRGNHDRFSTNINKKYDVWDQKTITIEKQPIVLNHFCLRTWDRSHYNSWHLYAHSHGTLEPIGKSWDVGVDNNNFLPVSFEQIETIMKDRPDNPNLIRGK